MGQPSRGGGRVLGIPPDWILCGNGSDDILTIATRAFVGQPAPPAALPGATCLLQDLAELPGARARRSGSKRTGPQRRLRRRKRGADWFLPNPNSPSGTVIPPRQVLEFARRLPCPLLVDEAYADFAETNCLDLVAEEEKILVSRTLSKSYALAGLRFGYVVGQPRMIEQLAKVKDSYNCDALAIAGRRRRSPIAGGLPKTAPRFSPRGPARRGHAAAARFVTVDSQANFTWNVHPEQPRLYEGSNSAASSSDT